MSALDPLFIIDFTLHTCIGRSERNINYVELFTTSYYAAFDGRLKFNNVFPHPRRK